MSLESAMDDLAVTALRVKSERDRFEREAKELQRRLDEILDTIDGMEDVEDGDGGNQRPNLFMRIAMTARGTDRP